MKFVNKVKAKYDQYRTSGVPRMSRNDQSVSNATSGMTDVIEYYVTNHSSNITLIGNKSQLLANKSTYGVAEIDDSIFDAMFIENSAGALKTFNTDGTGNGAVLVKKNSSGGGTAYYVANHTHYDEMLEAMALKVAQRVAISNSQTATANAIGAVYNTYVGNFSD